MAKKSLSILEWGLGIGGKPEAVEGKQASTLKDTTASRKYWCAIWLLWWILEEKIKAGMVGRGVKLLDGEHDLKQRKQRRREGIDAMPVVDGKRVSLKNRKILDQSVK